MNRRKHPPISARNWETEDFEEEFDTAARHRRFKEDEVTAELARKGAARARQNFYRPRFG